MKNGIHIMILSLMLLPVSAHALTFNAPNRELTPNEKKVGSVYRGCNGFYCLEEDPQMSLAVTVSAEPCQAGVEIRQASAEGSYICLTAGTSAREGLLIRMTAESETETCFDGSAGGMGAMGPLSEGCAGIRGQTTVMGTEDQTEAAFGRLRLKDAETSEIKLMMVIAY